MSRFKVFGPYSHFGLLITNINSCNGRKDYTHEHSTLSGVYILVLKPQRMILGHRNWWYLKQFYLGHVSLTDIKLQRKGNYAQTELEKQNPMERG